MEKTPGKSKEGATSSGKSNHGSRSSRSSRDRHPGLPESPHLGLLSCDPSTTNQMLQSWYNYSMYNMFLNAVANQAAVADMMNRSQMQLMPDLTSPKPGMPPKKGAAAPGGPTSQSHSNQRHSTSHSHSSAVSNNTASSTSRVAKSSLLRNDASSLSATKVPSLSSTASANRLLQRHQSSSVAPLLRDSSSYVKDMHTQHNTRHSSAASSSSHVSSRNTIPAHVNKDTNKLIDDLLHKAYGKPPGPSTKTIVPAHSKKEITSVPDRTRDCYGNLFRPPAFTAKQVTDPTSDIPKSILRNNGNEADIVLDLSKSRSVTSSNNNCPPQSEAAVSQACQNLNETCSSSLLTARRPDRRNSKGILSKRPRIMDNPYLQKVCAAGLRTSSGDGAGSGYTNEGSKMLKLESTEVSSMIDRLFSSVGVSSGMEQESDSKPDVGDETVKSQSTPMETENPCDEVTSSESPLSKQPVDKTTSKKQPNRVSPGGDNMVSSCDMELSPTQSSGGNDQNESPSRGVKAPDGDCENSASTLNESALCFDSGLRMNHTDDTSTKSRGFDTSTVADAEPLSYSDLEQNDGDLKHSIKNSFKGSEHSEVEFVRANEQYSGDSDMEAPEQDKVNLSGVKCEASFDTFDVETNSDKVCTGTLISETEMKTESNSCRVLDPETGLFKLGSPKSELEEEDPLDNVGYSVSECGLSGSDVKLEDGTKSPLNNVNSIMKSELKSETDSLNEFESYHFKDNISESSMPPFFCKTWNFRDRRYELDKAKTDRKSTDSDSESKLLFNSKFKPNNTKSNSSDAERIDTVCPSDDDVEDTDNMDKECCFPSYSSGMIFPGFDADTDVTGENLDIKKEPSELSFSSVHTGKIISDSEETGSLPIISGSSRGRGATRGRKGKRGRKKLCDDIRKNHFCKKCGLGFAREGELERHKRSHLGQKLYVCEYCQKSFVRGYYYKLHVSLHEVSDTRSSPKPEQDSMDHYDTKDVSLGDGESEAGDLMEDSVSPKGSDSELDEKPPKEIAPPAAFEPEVDYKAFNSPRPDLDRSTTVPSVLDLLDGPISVEPEVKVHQDESRDLSALRISSVVTLSESKDDMTNRTPSPNPGPSDSSHLNTSPARVGVPKSRTPSPVLPGPSQLAECVRGTLSEKKKNSKLSPAPGPSQMANLDLIVQNTKQDANDTQKSNGIGDAFLGVPVKEESLGLKISSVTSLQNIQDGPKVEQSSPKVSNFVNFGSSSDAVKPNNLGMSSVKREYFDDISNADSLSRASILASAGLTVDTNITANYANSTMVTATPETDFSLILNTDPIPCTPSDFIFPDDEMFSNSPKEYLDLDTTTRPKASEIDPMKLLHVDSMLKIEPNNDHVVLNVRVETDIQFGAFETQANSCIQTLDTGIIKKEEPGEDGSAPCTSPCSPLSGINLNGLGSWDDSETSNFELVKEDLTYRPSLSDIALKSLGKVNRKGVKKPRKAKFLHRFKCKQCTKDFARYGDLKKHQSQHTGEDLSICEICGKVFIRHCFYMIHLKRHQGGKYVHQQCGLRFPSKTALKTHMRFCKHCSKKGDSHSSLLQDGTESTLGHSNNLWGNSDKSDIENYEGLIEPKSEKIECQNGGLENDDNGEYICDACGKKYIWLSALVYHKRCHTGEKPYSCPQCHKTFRSAGSLRIHIRYHNNERPYVCEICGKSYTERGTLKSHLKVHTGERKYKCEYCSKTFAWREHMRYHIKTHTGEKPHKCAECGKAFVNRSSLKIHLRSHSDLRPYACGLCDMKYKSSKQLLIHQRIHTGEMPFKCTECKMQFRALGNLKRHRMTHTKEKPLKCKFCPKMFRSHSNLNEHMNIHTGNRPHKCKLCGKKFANSGSLAKHIATHSDEKRFECDICKKCFRDKGDLKSHMRSHTDERPYACTICGQRFKHSCHVKKHMRTHSNER